MSSAQLLEPEVKTRAAMPVTETPTKSLHIVGVLDDRFRDSDVYRYWLALANRDVDTHITQHPDFVLKESEVFADQYGLPVICVVSVLDGEPVAAAVLCPKNINTSTCGGIGLNWNLYGYRLAGNRIIGKCDPTVRANLLHAVQCEVERRYAQFLLVEDLEDDAELTADLQETLARQQKTYQPSGLQERLKVELPATAVEYWSKFSSKTRNTFRRKRKKIGETRLVKVTDAAGISEFLESAHQVSQNTWQTYRLGLRVSNTESERELLTVMAEKNALRCYLLLQESTPVAFLIGNQFGQTFNYEEVGYDRDFSKLSPGQVLLLEVLDDLFEDNTPKWLDFGGGDAEYKRIFSTHCSKSGNLWIVPLRLRSRYTIKHLQACRTIKDFGRTIVTKTGLLTKARQLKRRA